MKTVMQELIDDFTELSKKEGDSGFVGRSVLVIIKNKGYIEKEKLQIGKSFTDGAEYELYGSDLTCEQRAERYYNEMYSIWNQE